MAFYVQVIWKRGIARNRLLAFATIALFILCTLHSILVLAAVATLVRSGQGDTEFLLETPFTGLSVAANLVYSTANVLADAIFILRCYTIWSFQKKIIVIPILLTLGVAVIGGLNASVEVANSAGFSLVGFGLGITLSSVLLFYISIGVSLFTTFILMGLTVGRIWMLARTARRVLGADLTGTYHTVCAMILESGALYVCSGVAFIVLAEQGLVSIDAGMGIVLAQLLGIAPTIIAVRVALGQSVENVDSFIVPRPRVRSPFHQVGASDAADPAGDGVLYIRPESVKVEAV